MAVTTLGIKNRNLASTSTLMDRYTTFYIPNPAAVAPVPANKTIRFSDPNEALVLLGFQGSINSIAGGITTFNLNISNSTGTMLTATISLKAHAQEIVNAIVGTNNVLAAGEVCTILLTSSNNENAFDLTVVAKWRPYVGRETRTL